MNTLAELEKTEGLEKTEAPEQTEKLEVLHRRWEALNETIEIYKRRLQDEEQVSLVKSLQVFVRSLFSSSYRKEKTWSSGRARILLCLLKRLQTFAEGHFNYFYDGFQTGTLKDFDQEDFKEYPPGHVLNVILDQIGKDLDVIQQSATDVALSGNGLVTTTLSRADYLALEALKPAAQLDLKRTTVVNYFQRSAVNRVVPYDNDAIALFGIPFTSVGVLRDFLAIPHEVGHYVFWNGRVGGEKKPIWEKLNEEVNDKSKGIAGLVRPWLEEIFADVYGCLVAGPVIALDFQDMQLLESKVRFTRDDGVHPAPVVRPDNYTEVVRRQGLTEWAGHLESRWQERLSRRGNPRKVNDIPLSSVRDEMGKVVDLVYDLLKDLDFTSDNWWRRQLSSTKVITEVLEQLYQDFEEKVSKLTLDNLSDKLSYEPEDCNIDGLYEAWKIKINSSGAYRVTGREDEPEWGRIWIADGWATKGPKSND